MLSFLTKLHGILSRNCCPSVRLTDTYPVAITPPCGKNVQQRPLVMGANAIGVFSSRAQILRSLDERDKSVHISRPGARPPGHATITCKHLLRGCVRRFLLLPVIRHCGQVQAFRREAHRSQGANVDIAVVHGGVELGVAEEEETGQETWRDGPPPPFIYSPPGRRQTAPAMKRLLTHL